MTNRPWMAAIEGQFATLDMETRFQATTKGLGRPGRDYLAFKSWVDCQLLKRAVPYAWSDDCRRAVLKAAQSIPDTSTLSLANIPDAAAWFWFDQPWDLQTVTNPDLKVQALLVGWVQRGQGDDPIGGPRIDLAVTTFVTDRLADGKVHQIPTQAMAWKPGESVSELTVRARREYRSAYGPGGPFRSQTDRVGEDVTIATADTLARFILAAFAWLRQRVLVTSDGHVERHVRRRAERDHPDAQVARDVKVVALRRLDHQPRPAGDSQAVDWSCQWIVDGHFRNQWYPSLGTHQVIWIDPYTKGPADKPLKVPIHTVFAVER